MFCQKCGTKAIDGADFCQKCGAKLIHDASPEQLAPSTPVSIEQQSNPVPSNTPKKKKMPKVILAVVGVFAVIAIAAIALNFAGRTKYPDELLFNDLPATRFLEMTREDVITELGQPDSTAFDGIDAYQQEGIYHIAYSENSGKVIYITFSTEKSTCNGKKLSTTAERALTATSSTNLDRPFWRKGPISIYDEEYSVHGMFYDGGSSDIKFYSLGRFEDSYTIDFITTVFDKNSNEEEMLEISLYTDEWIETVKRSGFSAEVQNAYAEKVRELAAENNSLRFDLIDLTASATPELVADCVGYYISIFIWKNGEVVPVGGEWGELPYGAMGNLGYEYLPGQNVILNYNNDQAGAIAYEIYSSINSANDLEPLPMDQLSMWHFRDANGNGIMDENESFLEDPLYYVGNTEVSKDTYFSYRIQGNFEMISGDKTAEEMLALLGYSYGEPREPYVNSASIDLYHEGVSLISLLGCAPVELYNTLGTPTSGTPVNGEMYEGGEYYGYDGISFHIDFVTNTVRWITAAPFAIEVNGVTLEQPRSGLIDLLGVPDSEDSYHDELDDEDVCEMRYSFSGGELLIKMADVNNIPYSILISSSES